MAIRYEADIKEKYSRYAGTGRKSFGNLSIGHPCLPRHAGLIDAYLYRFGQLVKLPPR
jgi:hypothetical protein